MWERNQEYYASDLSWYGCFVKHLSVYCEEPKVSVGFVTPDASENVEYLILNESCCKRVEYENFFADWTEFLGVYANEIATYAFSEKMAFPS